MIFKITRILLPEEVANEQFLSWSSSETNPICTECCNCLNNSNACEKTILTYYVYKHTQNYCSGTLVFPLIDFFVEVSFSL